jgi:hypothetical protein
MNLCGIDLETGGLVPGRHPILMIGCYAVVSGGVRGLKIYVKPGHGQPEEIDPAAVRKNGYSEDLWRANKAVRLDTAMMEVMAFFSQLRCAAGGNRVRLVSHFAMGVDRPFIEWMVRHHGVENVWDELVNGKWRCSAGALQFLMDAGVVPEGSASLDRLLDLMGTRRAGAVHDAAEDARFAWCGYHWCVGVVGGQRTEDGGRRAEWAAAEAPGGAPGEAGGAPAIPFRGEHMLTPELITETVNDSPVEGPAHDEGAPADVLEEGPLTPCARCGGLLAVRWEDLEVEGTVIYCADCLERMCRAERDAGALEIPPAGFVAGG